jgi:aconitate decarboxylase
MISVCSIMFDDVTGMREHFGSHTKAFGVGKAAQSGLQVAFMAQGGLTASETANDGKRG